VQLGSQPSAATISDRHREYALADGAAIIGLVERHSRGWRLTASGRALSVTQPGSKQEAEAIAAAMLTDPFIAQVVGGPDLPTSELEALIKGAGFSESSARRRAPCLRAWRRHYQAHAGAVAAAASSAPGQP
jgi:hypothetical protein